MFSDVLWIPQLEIILLEKTKSGLWGAVNMSLRRYMIDVYFLAIFPPFFSQCCVHFVHAQQNFSLFYFINFPLCSCMPITKKQQQKKK